jgi:hypothetical protein
VEQVLVEILAKLGSRVLKDNKVLPDRLDSRDKKASLETQAHQDRKVDLG